MKYSNTDLEAIREEIIKDGDNYSFDQRLDQFLKDYKFDDEASYDAFVLTREVRKYIMVQFVTWLAFEENCAAYCAGSSTADTFYNNPKGVLTGFAAWLENDVENFDEGMFIELTEDED